MNPCPPLCRGVAPWPCPDHLIPTPGSHKESQSRATTAKDYFILAQPVRPQHGNNRQHRSRYNLERKLFPYPLAKEEEEEEEAARAAEPPLRVMGAGEGVSMPPTPSPAPLPAQGPELWGWFPASPTLPQFPSPHLGKAGEGGSDMSPNQHKRGQDPPPKPARGSKGCPSMSPPPSQLSSHHPSKGTGPQGHRGHRVHCPGRHGAITQQGAYPTRGKHLFFPPHPSPTPPGSLLRHKYIKDILPHPQSPPNLPQAAPAPLSVPPRRWLVLRGVKAGRARGRAPHGPNHPREQRGQRVSGTSPQPCGVPARCRPRHPRQMTQKKVTEADSARAVQPWASAFCPGGGRKGSEGLVVRSRRPQAARHMISQQEFCFRAWEEKKKRE